MKPEYGRTSLMDLSNLAQRWQNFHHTMRDLWAALPHPTTTHYNSAFGSSAKLLTHQNTGFCLTGRRRLSREHSHRHCILYGMTGSGKSSLSLAMSLFTTTGSMVVFDPGSHLYNATASAMYVYRGYQVKRLNFSNPAVSSGFNPLSFARTDTEINQLAELLITIALGSSPQSVYWNESGIELLRLMIKLVFTRQKKYHTLAHVYHLLSYIEAEPEKVLQLIKATHQPKLILQLKSFLARDSKLRTSVITTVQAALQRYADPKIGLVSSHTNLDLQQLRKRPTVIYVQVSPEDHSYYRTPHSVFWELLFRQLLKATVQADDLSVYLLIDEAGWVTLPSLPTILAVARKSFGVMLAVQNAEQLEAAYGPEGRATIEANAWSKLFLSAQAPKTATDLSRLLGHTLVDDAQRPLMSELEIRMMTNRQGLLLCGNEKPMLVKLHPYYEQPKYKAWAKFSQRYPMPSICQHPASQLAYGK